MKKIYVKTLIAILWVISLKSTFAQQKFDLQEVEAAKSHIRNYQAKLNIKNSDLDQLVVSSAYRSASTGWYHVYFNQTHLGISVYNAMINVTTFNGHLKHISSSFEPNVLQPTPSDMVPTAMIGAEKAVKAAFSSVNLTLGKNFKPLNHTSNQFGLEISTSFADPGVSDEPIHSKLYWLVYTDSTSKKKKAALTYQIKFLNNAHSDAWNIHVDAATGKILGSVNEVIKCDFGSDTEHRHLSTENIENHLETKDLNAANTYRVFDLPIESPTFGSRSLVTNPFTKFAPLGIGPGSTNGWHSNGITDFTSTVGNNVSAQEDTDASNTGGNRPSSSTLDFDYPYTQGLNTSAVNQNAAIVNLFYWNNLIHDVLYKFGFDETSGNFQTNNLGRGGLGNDHVFADAQDGSGTNNANFYTPVDGANPRMQMFLWNYGTSYQGDSDFDNTVIAHEYGHGWSTRLTGGPANSSCLQNVEQGGEGWSDYLGLMLTTNWAALTPTVASANIPKGIGTYLIAQPTSGGGIRPYRYSYDMANVNPLVKYSAVGNATSFSQPHGIGSIWATMLWDMTWEIIFQDNQIINNIYDVTNIRGNVAALKLVSEGLKLQPCSPSFVDARDAILAADLALFNGRYRCAIGKAFARRGLGVFASTGSSSNDRAVTEDFTPFNSNALTSPKSYSMCTNLVFDYVATSNTPGTSFTWSRDAVSGISNPAASGSSNIISETLINTTSNAIMVIYKFYLSPDACGTIVSQNVEVLVSPQSFTPIQTTYSICQGFTVPIGEGLKIPAEVYTTNISNTLTLQNGTYDRAESGTFPYVSAGFKTYFKTYKFVANTTGSVSFDLTSSTVDCFLSIYKDHFYPNQPATNYLNSDDDNGAGVNSYLNITLQAGKTYILVASSFYPGEVGLVNLTASVSGLTPWYIWEKANGTELFSGPTFNPIGIDMPSSLVPGVFHYNVFDSNNRSCKFPATFTISPASFNPVQNGTLSANKTICAIFNNETLSLTGNSGTILGWEKSETDFQNTEHIHSSSNTFLTSGLIKTTKYRVISKTAECEISRSNTIRLAVVSKDLFSNDTLTNLQDSTRVAHYFRSKERILPTSNIKYVAGRSITLDTSFVVENGSTFLAEIQSNNCYIPVVFVQQPDASTGIDTDISSGYPNNNFSSAKYMIPYSWLNFGLAETRRALIKFDLSTIPANALIDSAFIDLNFSDSFVSENPPHAGHFGANIFEVRRINSSWEHNTVNWANQPSTLAEDVVIVQAATALNQNYKHINITEIIKDQMVENHGLMIQHQIENPYKLTALATSNDPNPAHRPKLVVYYRYL